LCFFLNFPHSGDGGLQNFQARARLDAFLGEEAPEQAGAGLSVYETYHVARDGGKPGAARKFGGGII
jgi:hypothetical protein